MMEAVSSDVPPPLRSAGRDSSHNAWSWRDISRNRFFVFVALFGSFVQGSQAPGADSSAPASIYLEEVKHVLRERCTACHGGLKQEAGLRVDTAAGLLAGGQSGPPVVGGKPESSFLLDRLRATSLDERMPPEGKPLKPEQIDAISRWIAAGAPTPAGEEPDEDPTRHWSFQPPVRPPLPQSDHAGARTGGHPIDAFIDDSLASAGLDPRPAADKATLLRRVTLDLLGVPPTQDELRAFLADESSDAYDRVVDRLLASPLHGERWGRHWMDVWRYSDWHGRRMVDDVRSSAGQIFRWRDWIVKSLNDNAPYDSMVRDMLAADEIRPGDREAGVATGFLVRSYFSMNSNDWLRSVVEHTGKAFLGLTTNCAHCHDHKFDPLTMEDYFAIRAFFEPMWVRQDRWVDEADPGQFEEYIYGGKRKVQRLGSVQIFDKSPEKPTWLYTGGDERNEKKEKGPIAPAVPKFLSGGRAVEIRPVELPLQAYYPGTAPEIRRTILDESVRNAESARQRLANARRDFRGPTPEMLAELHATLAEIDRVRADAVGAPLLEPLKGQGSLVLDAADGRIAVVRKLDQSPAVAGDCEIGFDVAILNDTHFNFQILKSASRGETALVVAFESGRVWSYAPGSSKRVQLAAYDGARVENRFRVSILTQFPKAIAMLTIRDQDGSVLVRDIAIALNSISTLLAPGVAIAFDARSGSLVAVDDVTVRKAPQAEGDRTTPPADAPSQAEAAPAATVQFTFEPGGDAAAGMAGWESSVFSLLPGLASVRERILNRSLAALEARRVAAQRAIDLPTLRVRAAEADAEAMGAVAAATRARLEADAARHGIGCDETADRGKFAKQAAVCEATAAVAVARAAVSAGEVTVAEAEEARAAAAADAAKDEILKLAGKAIAARAALRESRKKLAAAEKKLSDEPADDYSPVSGFYPATSTGRRKAFAEWLTGPNNPLFARVAVNHMWMRHFVRPIVETVFDFGRSGAKPTHPALLDWLAVEFMESGYDMKHMHRLMVTSRAYQRVSSDGGGPQASIDPDNRLLWRMNVGRMEAEAVRDSILSVAGGLDLSRGGPELESSEVLTTARRSLYYSCHPEEGGKGPFGELFDGPDANDCYRRSRTVVPQQALALANSTLVHEQSAKIVKLVAEDLAKDRQDDAGAFVDLAFERVLSRLPGSEERRLCVAFLRAAESGDAEARDARRRGLVRALLNHNDFVAIR
jgi:hypothetical protein